MDCFCKNPLNSAYAKLGWESVCHYVTVYNTKNEDFIDTTITEISQIFSGYRHCTADLQTPIVTSYSNIYPTKCNVTPFILSGNCPTCFGWYHNPSSRSQTTVSTASGICHTVTAICRYSGM